MPKRYPPAFRRKVLDLLKASRSVAGVAAALDVSAQTIYNWRELELIDTSQRAGLLSTDNAELAAARKRIAELETELAATSRAAELMKKELVRPKRRYAAVSVMAMQTELLDRRKWRTRVELKNAIFEYLEIFHNRQRRHSALTMRTPIEYEMIRADQQPVA